MCLLRAQHLTGRHLSPAARAQVTPFHHADASHGKSGLRPQSPTLTRRFQAAVGSEKEKKIDTEGGHDAPENFLLTQAACTAYSLKLPTPQQPATPA
ncbi:hypothetical protein EWK08_01100 [Salmonella enterica subsp. enterica]|nr:hypothetical protein [Salmonella enterica]EAW0945098.1 hypothetical protein [Salmonella enterica]ECD2080619.1 hypothetical protein [Salmonella enterica subsp. enterica]ECI4972892.1 hypothetical protein [Salmonella enterica subsp. enterica]